MAFWWVSIRILEAFANTRFELSRPYQPTKSVQAAFILGLVAVIVIGLNYPVTSITIDFVSESDFYGGQASPDACIVTQAGFPWSFYTEVTGFGVTSSDHSFVAGLGDLAATVAVFAVVVFWLYCRFGQPSRNVLRWIGHRVSGAAFAASLVLTVTGLTACSIKFRSDVETRASVALDSGSSATQGFVINEYLARRLPISMRGSWKHVLSVELSRFDHETLESVSKLPYVNAISLRRGNFDDQAVDELAKLKMLRKLTIRDVDCSGLTADGVSKLTQLISLDILRAELSEPVASAIVSLPHLRELSARVSRDSIARLGCLVSGSAIEVLELLVTDTHEQLASDLRPADAIEKADFAMQIANAVQLKSLSIQGSQGSRVELSLTNLPRLNVLNLSALNVVSLKGDQLPRLHSLDLFSEGHGVSSEDDYELAFPLFDRLELAGCGILKELHLHSRHIESVEISNSPHLASISLERWPVRFQVRRQGRDTKRESDDVRYGRLVSQISNVSSLQNLEMTGLDLTKVDLAPLEKLPRLTSLNVSDSVVDANQVLGFMAIKKLDSLNIERTGTSSKIVDALLCGSDRWKRLMLGAVRYDRLVLTNQENLTEIFGQELIRANHVVLMNLPNLEDQLQLVGRDIESLRIENAPRLRGIVLEGELPKNSVISDVPSLDVFEATGAGVTDTILANVCESPEIRRLSIGNSAVTRDALSIIAGLRSLVVLHLANTPVDDEVVGQWSNLPFLRDVVLDGTKISGKSIETIAKIDNLQRLSLSHTNLSPEDLRPLADVSTIIRLDIAGVGILPETLEQIAKSGFLTQLDLSGVNISEDLFRVLLSRDLRKLALLSIGGSGLTDTQVLALAHTHPNLYFHAPRNEFSETVTASLASDERLLTGPVFFGRAVVSNNAGRVALELPYAAPSSISQTRLNRSLDRQSRVPRQLNP